MCEQELFGISSNGDRLTTILSEIYSMAAWSFNGDRRLTANHVSAISSVTVPDSFMSPVQPQVGEFGEK